MMAVTDIRRSRRLEFQPVFRSSERSHAAPRFSNVPPGYTCRPCLVFDPIRMEGRHGRSRHPLIYRYMLSRPQKKIPVSQGWHKLARSALKSSTTSSPRELRIYSPLRDTFQRAQRSSGAHVYLHRRRNSIHVRHRAKSSRCVVVGSYCCSTWAGHL